ncbi:DUF2500 domain-containing protein [Indiicoccus explosivorum]|uniref:DUF2500 domain-containing protein n=1 Tax=Indiicoccus explosivorum TaxID=1917864 RepID=UPI000B44D135|nr:DUF2500 domain-containing protein [Indiicoccus explosivorum]
MLDPGGDLLFRIVPIFIGFVFLIVAGIIIFTAVKGISVWARNNSQPRREEEARAISKRTDIRGGGETRARSLYFITFEFPNGDRTEFRVDGRTMGQITEGDVGKLHFQGTRFLQFDRNRT